jgi:hypothetical protein
LRLRCGTRRFGGDAAITCVAATPTHFLAGSANGAVHLLRLWL